MEQLKTKLAAVWEELKENYGDRISVVEKAIALLQESPLNEELQKQALSELHTLIGTLGSFGFVEASRLADEIKQILQQINHLSSEKLEYLSQLVVLLRKELNQPFAVSNLEISTPVKTPPKQSSSPRLLIVDDDPALASVLSLEAVQWGIHAEVVCDVPSAREAIANSRPDIVLLDLCFPNAQEDGLVLLEELATYQPPLPVIVFTVQESFDNRVNVARFGGCCFLQKPTPPTEVMEAISQTLQQVTKIKAKLLIIDDDKQMLKFLQTLLEPWGFELTLVNSPNQFWEVLEQTAPDLLVLDVEMPEFSGIDLCQVVRNEPRWSQLPVLFVSVHKDTSIVEQVFKAGADDFISKPIVVSELVERVLKRLERTRSLRRSVGCGV
ncbi:MAG: response regulator [Scytonema sp. PMC 1069.18]|nr:response regulator [Scytonema sp. PMC 1069.18]MEC4881100.1 response regulator [Scytonema sp. PMC 1070.18]